MKVLTYCGLVMPYGNENIIARKNSHVSPS